MHLTALDNLSFPTRLASSASLCCFTQAAAQGRPGTVTQAPGTCCDTSPAPQVWHNRYCCPRPFKTLWNHPRSLCQKKKKKWHFIHLFKATQDRAFLRQMLPLPAVQSWPPSKTGSPTLSSYNRSYSICLSIVNILSLLWSVSSSSSVMTRAKGDEGMHARRN